MKTSFALVALVLLGGCTKNWVKADREHIVGLAAPDMQCGTSKAEVVYQGLRGPDVPASSPCFGEKATQLAVVECAGKHKAYWKYPDGNWEAVPGTVNSVDASGVEISLGAASNESGGVSATARCAR
jgi:hypothetical protein